MNIIFRALAIMPLVLQVTNGIIASALKIMNIIFRALAIMPLVLQVTNVNSADQVKTVAVERGATGVKSEPLLQGGVTIKGSTQVFRPLPPEEVEQLGREGVKRKMMEQKR